MPAAPERLRRHLMAWLGEWPEGGGLTVTGSAARALPGWDGEVHPVLAVFSPEGGVVSVAPERVAETRLLLDDVDPADHAMIAKRLDGAWGLFRFSMSPVSTPDVGDWVPTSDPRVPEWLKPFNGDVLIAWDDDGRYGAGVGRKLHDRWGHELSVGTEPALRGRGIGRLLVAAAARRVIADGAIPTYLHIPENHASAKLAEAAGFRDLGWRFVSASH